MKKNLHPRFPVEFSDLKTNCQVRKAHSEALGVPTPFMVFRVMYTIFFLEVPKVGVKRSQNVTSTSCQCNIVCK